jgi:hypothetical protein
MLKTYDTVKSLLEQSVVVFLSEYSLTLDKRIHQVYEIIFNPPFFFNYFSEKSYNSIK